MQSASDLPPPPGALGFDWLGLSDEVPGERASEEPPEEPPPPVKVLMGTGSDMGCSGGTNDPGCAVVGVVDVVVAAAPAGDVGPAEGAGDDEVDGAADALLGDALGVVRMVGAESLRLGAATGADERACANAASGSSSTSAMAARNSGLGVSIAITMVLPAVPGTRMGCSSTPYIPSKDRL